MNISECFYWNLIICCDSRERRAERERAAFLSWHWTDPSEQCERATMSPGSAVARRALLAALAVSASLASLE